MFEEYCIYNYWALIVQSEGEGTDRREFFFFFFSLTYNRKHMERCSAGGGWGGVGGLGCGWILCFCWRRWLARKRSLNCFSRRWVNDVSSGSSVASSASSSISQQDVFEHSGSSSSWYWAWRSRNSEYGGSWQIHGMPSKDSDWPSRLFSGQKVSLAAKISGHDRSSRRRRESSRSKRSPSEPERKLHIGSQ